MKLNSEMVERTVEQFPCRPIPEDHPAVPQLSSMFGEHTFFLDEEGLHIVEPSQANFDGSHKGQVVKLASWSDESRTSLAPHEPVESDVTVSLEAA